MNRYVYYPLQQGIDPKQLPIRTHNEMLISTNEIEHLKGDHRETHISNCGWFDMYNKFLRRLIFFYNFKNCNL